MRTNKEIKHSEKEQKLLLSLVAQMLTIRERDHLLIFTNVKLKTLVPFTRSWILLLDATQQNYRNFQPEESQWRKLSPLVGHILNTGKPAIVPASEWDHIYDCEQDSDPLLSEFIVMGLGTNNTTTAILALATPDNHTFNQQHLDMLWELSLQLSVALSNVLSNEEILRRGNEMRNLLSLNHLMARMKDRNDLLQIINQQLKKLVYFNYSTTMLVSPDKQTFSMYILDPQSISGRHPDYNFVTQNEHPVNDGFFNKAMESEDPVVFNVEEIVEQKDSSYPGYLKIFYESGVKQVVAVNLINEKEKFGMFVLYSEKKNNFNEDNLRLVKGISSLISIGVSNIIANDEISVRNAEKEMLLTLSNEIAKVYNKDNLLQLVNMQLKKLVSYTYSNITVVNDDGHTFTPYAVDPDSALKARPDFESFLSAKFVIDDLMKRVLLDNEPQVFNIMHAAASSTLPVYLAPAFENGLHELAAIRLRDEKEIFGVLSFFSDRTDSFSENHLQIIKAVGSQVSTALARIIANEKITLREKEKETLLSISHEMARIRDKNDLLELINTKLKKLFYFTHSSISAITPDRKNFVVYLTDPNSRSRQHGEFEVMISKPYPIKDQVFEHFIRTEGPTISDYEEVMKLDDPPFYTKIHYEAGMREAVSIPLQGEKEVWGVLHFYSDKKNTFTTNNVNIIKGVASQVAIAVSNILAIEDIAAREKEKTALLSISYAIGKVRDKSDLLHFINTQFKTFFYFTSCSILCIQEDRETFGMYMIDPQSKSILHPDYADVVSGAYPIEDGIIDKVLANDEPTVINYKKIISRSDAPVYARLHYDSGYREAAMIPLYGEKQVWGILYFGSDKEKTFGSNYLNILKGLASQVAIAISNIISNEEIKAREREKEVLLSISYEIGNIRDKNELLAFINSKLKKLFYFTHSSISAINEDRKTFTVFLTDPGSKSKDHPDFIKMITARYPINDGIYDEFLRSEEPVISDIEKNASYEWAPRYTQIHFEAGLLEAITIQMKGEKEVFGTLTFYSDKKKSFTKKNINIIKGVASQLTVAVSNILAHEEINNYKRQLEEENSYLQEEIEGSYNHSEIVGTGPEMQDIFQLVSQVSFTSSTVLILGETGTGKELIARAIHNASPRKDKIMIKVNCAALPANLIESELFGHERGSFTGATERRIGKFELANHSTLFLDEIGEMPPDLQVKLLRTLQEKEIERVGGKTTIKVDVRIIAATNRNLQQEVSLGNFRSDLFYRLSVFPITLPPLRTRKNDIPALTMHFIKRFAKNSGKKINNIASRALQELMNYPWPGNVRELEHLVERTVLMTHGNVIKDILLPVTEKSSSSEGIETRVKTIEENERDHILKALKQAKGKVFGAGGAAELLDVPYSTLTSKMKKLGIKREHFFSGSR